MYAVIQWMKEALNAAVQWKVCIGLFMPVYVLLFPEEINCRHPERFMDI